MINENYVVFKGKKNGIVILLDESIPFLQLKDIFKEKVSDAKKFFGVGKTSISFKGRELTEDEETELLNIMKTESDLNISFVDEEFLIMPASPNVIHFEELSKEENVLTLDVFTSKDNVTHYHKGSLRSGQSIRYPGSVVVIGDVNPGGEVIAEGNIIILGTLKGLVHAGCSGNCDCFVSSFNLMPTQLRIADIITYIPNDMKIKNKIKFKPSYAYIEDGQIYIAPLINEA